MSFFQAEQISAGYGAKPALQSVSFFCESGLLFGILGANGSGKTTLMKAICGVLPHEGNCTLDGISLEKLSPRQIAKLCSYIPQRSGISIDISAMDVVLMGYNPRLGLLEQPDKKMQEKARAALCQVGLEEHIEDNYLTLSEGQKQLCILARTLVSDCRLLLLDEPESALDFRYRYQMLDILKQWVRKEPRAAILTLHDPELALRYCDRLLLLRDGKVTGILNPASDSLENMEAQLSQIYGKVSLIRCMDHQNMKHLVMLKEKEGVTWNQ
ncbi:MAG: ABC transporter ATP-binding protein [Lachnospiraceae bacterium]|nr:ABC transporter ATP-binding protein [Lachnospiraceae bacterium]